MTEKQKTMFEELVGKAVASLMAKSPKEWMGRLVGEKVPEASLGVYRALPDETRKGIRRKLGIDPLDPPLAYRCPHCGAGNGWIEHDAMVRWCVPTQTWEITSTLDGATCAKCGNEIKPGDGSYHLEAEELETWPEDHWDERAQDHGAGPDPGEEPAPAFKEVSE